MKSDRANRLIHRYESLLRTRNAGAEPPVAAARTAAVFVLFTVREGQAEVLLMRRPRERGRHRGEWAFPGGMMEPGDGELLQTAFRETEEELGIPASAIDHWGPLDPVTTVGTEFLVWPFTGWLDPAAIIIPSPDEVEEVVQFPVETFTTGSMRRTIRLHRGGQVRDLRAYVHNGMVVWGATARILAQIFDMTGPEIDEKDQQVSKVVGN